MQLFVEHIVEPQRLLLAWQAPDHMHNRRRWVVAKIEAATRPWTLSYLDAESFELANPGAAYADAAALGYEGYPAFRRSVGTVKVGVQEALMRRLPPRSRPDFIDYIQRFGFRDDKGLSDAALLAYTEAKLPSDGFSLVGELDQSLQVGDLIFDIAGTRHQVPNKYSPPAIGDELHLRREPSNPFDPFAIEVLWNGVRIGYVNRLQAKAVGYWMEHREVQVRVQRVNGRAGNPKVYALVKVRPAKDHLAA